MKKSVTLSVAISAPFSEVFNYVSNPKSLPVWSVNFIKEVIESEGGWLAVTPMGTVPLNILSDSKSGIIDLVFGNQGIPDLQEELDLLKKIMETNN